MSCMNVVGLGQGSCVCFETSRARKTVVGVGLGGMVAME